MDLTCEDADGKNSFKLISLKILTEMNHADSIYNIEYAASLNDKIYFKDFGVLEIHTLYYSSKHNCEVSIF